MPVKVTGSSFGTYSKLLYQPINHRHRELGEDKPFKILKAPSKCLSLNFLNKSPFVRLIFFLKISPSEF